MLLTAFKSSSEIAQIPPTVLPKSWHPENFRDALEAAPFGLYLGNTIIYAVSVTTGLVLLSSMAAYGFARLDFPGRRVLFVVYLATMMVPFQLTLIPVYILLSRIGWVDTYQGIIVPQLFGAFGVFLLRQFFLGIPRELEEAAMIDGAGRWRIYWSIMLPLAKPAVITLAVFTFIGQWNGLLWPLLISSSDRTRPIAAGLLAFSSVIGTDWRLMMAAAAMTAVPITCIYIVAQRWIVQGVASSGFGGR
ncbi:multiple sugar transport system permease protein [Kribbella aluminosa]|uniref:Multiple sugar transport system permease protein n=1 Tax=Kribbella aluminosa TaxID=416017 RepID=A0ABS4UJH3_9ACTN|nr:carbohydrate ABC transporter permease [Kribbella aluminosa]MBP2351801.1 multiple sugar transport system permease protein [Kribbella aluminosa]